MSEKYISLDNLNRYNERLKEKYLTPLEQKINSKVDSVPQSDYNQTNPEAKDYIKNKPFYSEINEIEKVANASFTTQPIIPIENGFLYGVQTFYSGYRQIEVPYSELTFKVELDGQTYDNLTVKEECYLGNLSLLNIEKGTTHENSGEPFLVFLDEDFCQFRTKLTEPSSHQFGLYAYQEISHKLDLKYLPVDQMYNGESINPQSGAAVKEAINSETLYSNSDPVLTTIGGIAAGTTFENVPFRDLITNLLYPYTKPTVGTVTLNPAAGVRKAGASVSLTSVSVPITKKTKQISTVDLYKGNTSLKSVSGSHITSSGTTITFSGLNETITANTTFTVKVSEKDGTKDVASNSASYTFVNPYYQGVIDSSNNNSTNITATLITALNEKVETKGAKTWSYTTTETQCAVIAYPASYGVLKKIEDPNGFGQTWTSYTITINDVSYYVYVSAAAAATNCTYKFTY